MKFIISIVVVALCIVVAVTDPVTVNRNNSERETEGPVVNTNVGPIRGLTSPEGNYKFLGIPYAKVNLANPFGPSIPHEDFDEIFNAFDDSSSCPHRDAFTPGAPVIGSLDCLHLHIHVPNVASTTNRVPVMVWIHGGSFVTGSAGRRLYDPAFLVAHDVIVVSVNYRLGAYGWLCLDIPEISGNQGLKDQLTALRWIKNNIEAFGGDAERITLFGGSSGAVSIDFHYLFSHEDLFNSVILQSGTALSYYSYNSTDSSALLKFAAHLGHVTDDLQNALEFLSGVDVEVIVKATDETGLPVRPCIEKKFENVEWYVNAHPNYIDVPNAKTKSVLVGFNNNEFGANFLNLEGDPLLVIHDNYNFNQELLGRATKILRNFYIGDKDFDEDEEDRRIGNFRSDFLFLHPTYRMIRKYLENGASSIYHYMFSYRGGRNIFSVIWNANVEGAIHADELAYLFDAFLLPMTPSPADQLIIDRMTTLWTNFAKYGNPTPETSDILPFVWPAVTNESMYCLNINSELLLQRRAFHYRMAFWDLYYKMFNSELI